MAKIIALILSWTLVSIAFAQTKVCCNEKIVGEFKYFLVGDDSKATEFPYNCKNDCVYTLGDGSRFCFRVGDLISECKDGEISVENALMAIDAMVARHVIMSQKLALSSISNETAMIIFPESGSCSFLQGLKCLSKIKGAVTTCYTKGKKRIVNCVKDIIGAVHECYSCACWVIEYLFKACSSPSNSEDMNMLLISAIKRHVDFAEKIKESGVLSESSLTIVPIPTPTCTVKQGLDCVAEVAPAVRDCYEEISKGKFTECIKEIVGIYNTCYGCICWVVEHLGFYCDEDESANLKLSIHDISSSFVTYSQNIIDSGISTDIAAAILPKPSACSIRTGVQCAAHVIWVVTECAVYINDGNLTACIKAIFGPSESCHDCICWIREFIGLDCTISDAETASLTNVHNAMVNGITNFHMKIVNSGISNDTALSIIPQYTHDCGFFTKIYCTPAVGAEYLSCQKSDPGNVYQCVADKNPPGSTCYGCICNELAKRGYYPSYCNHE